MARTEMMNRELNMAIWTVLKAKFKNECKEAFKAVEAAGYSIHKNGSGHWVVSNKETSRWICLSERGWKRYSHFVISHGAYERQQRRVADAEMYNKEIAFDFVGCLEKPVNQVWYDMARADVRSKAVQQFEALSTKKRYVEYKVDEINQIQKQMEKLQRDLMRAMEYKFGYEQDVKEYRKQIGLA